MGWIRRRHSTAVWRTVAQVWLLFVSFGTVSGASATELGLITGSEGGTYHRFGQDLKKLVKPGGINLRVYPSKGSVENILAIHQRSEVQMGIVQSDVLAFIAGLQSNPALNGIARNTRMVFPLHARRFTSSGAARSPASTTWRAGASPSAGKEVARM
jgi:TRAP-type uncharacterized transport system substrate-binding protein